MKALILSDIHSNMPALEAICRHEDDVDLIFCAGDLVDYGPYPKEVVDWARTNEVICVRGNHDHWLCMNYRRGLFFDAVPADKRGWVHHNASQLTDDDVDWLEQLPEAITFPLDGILYGMTHLVHHYEELVSRHAFLQFQQERFGGTSFDRLIVGHTHRQGVRYLSNEWLWMNPGSVSYRRRDDPDQTAHYITVENGRISLNALPYDLNRMVQAIEPLPLRQPEKQSSLRQFSSLSDVEDETDDELSDIGQSQDDIETFESNS